VTVLEVRSLLIYSSRQQPEFLQEDQDVLPVPNLASDLQLLLMCLVG
jgi:hypothetical protein